MLGRYAGTPYLERQKTTELLSTSVKYFLKLDSRHLLDGFAMYIAISAQNRFVYLSECGYQLQGKNLDSEWFLASLIELLPLRAGVYLVYLVYLRRKQFYTYEVATRISIYYITQFCICCSNLLTSACAQQSSEPQQKDYDDVHAGKDVSMPTETTTCKFRKG